MQKILLFFLLVVIQTIMLAQPRSIIHLNQNWQYWANPNENVATALQALEQNEVETIDLPHTWNQWDATDITPGYRRSASWYFKELTIAIDPNKRYVLYLEGANISSAIYVNKQLAGTHIGGYVGFEIDLTDYLQQGATNQIAIRVDNGYNPDIIPSQKADFFIYGGITRDVWLKVLSPEHIQDVQISTPEVSQEKATTTVQLQLNAPAAGLTAKMELYDPFGQRVAESKEVKVANDQLQVEMPTLKQPQLWSTAQPNLYELKVLLKKKGKLVDQTEEKFGYRWFRFDPYGAFYLNGERLKIRGTHRHEEHAGYGAALPNELHRRDVEMMKEMGANFVRLAHYPQDPEIYKACDELGLIVWDELPWCRGGMGGDNWQKNTMGLLEEQITQNYNHPSILFWSLGNEIYWLPDFEGGDDEKQLNTFLKKLNDKSHELDPYRMTAIRKYYAGSDIVDVFSPSIWSGWYAGVYQNYEATIKKNLKLYPRFLHMEYGGSSHVGRHT
ncbi:MAG: glycoside hydrolase family 2 TIM barrel-domain containing protein, partial [Bacteroidota bacterium]